MAKANDKKVVKVPRLATPLQRLDVHLVADLQWLQLSCHVVPPGEHSRQSTCVTIPPQPE